MQPFKISISNYRVFTDPITFIVDNGITAFVGPNNCGKSSLLRFFIKFRELWSCLSSDEILNYAKVNASRRINFQHVLDQEEVYNTRSSRDLEINVELLEDFSNATFTKVSCRFAPSQVGDFWPTLYDEQGNSLSALGMAAVTDGIVATNGRDHVSLRPLKNLMPSLQKSMYLPAFRNAINAGALSDYFGIQVGEAFIKQWRQWQSGPVKRQNNAIVEVIETIKGLFGFEQFTVTPSDKNDDLQLTVDGRSFRLREMGSGLAQFIIALGNVVIQGPHLLLVDEPELNLHPALQRRFLLSLLERVQGVVMATHNLALARGFGNHAYSLQRKNGAVKSQPLQDPRSLRELMGEMSYGALRELGCSSVLFVEGPHDVTVYTVFVQKLGLGGDVAVFPLGGDEIARGDVAPQLAELRRLGDEIAVVLDSERTSAGSSAKPERQKFLKEAAAQGIPCHLSEFRAIENYFPDRAVKLVVPPLSALSPFDEIPKAWAKQKSQNWKMATHMTIDEIKGNDIGKFLLSWMASRKTS